MDPSKLSVDGKAKLSQPVFSEDGKWVAYFLDEKGSDWKIAYIYDAHNK